MQDDDKIRQRAYQLWEDQGRPEGKHEDHWRQASNESGQDKDRPQEDPVEGDRATVERELDRQDDSKGQG